MGLKRVNNIDEVQMTFKEFKMFENSICKQCKNFNGFYTENGYPMYYNCLGHNTTGYDFVREMPQHGCSFYKK